MATKRESVLQAIKNLMTSLPGVLDANVYRSRATAFTRAQTPAVAIDWLSDDPSPVSIPVIDWSLRVRFSVIVRDDVPDQAADPIIQSIHSKLYADVSLGGLAIDILPAPHQNTILEADKPAGEISSDYIIRYRTRETDLSN